MEVTDIRIKYIQGDERLKAIVAVTFDNAFVVHDIRLIHVQEKYFLAMPSKRMNDGSYRDIAHPIQFEMRQKLENSILENYLSGLKTESII